MIANFIKLLYRLFKWSIYIAMIFAFIISAQCQEAVNEICEVTETCKPDYEKVDRLRDRPVGTTRKMKENNK